MHFKKNEITQNRYNFKEKNKVGGLTLPNFKTYDSLLLVKKKTNRTMEQNGQPKKRPHKYSQLILDKKARQP